MRRDTAGSRAFCIVQSYGVLGDYNDHSGRHVLTASRYGDGLT